MLHVSGYPSAFETQVEMIAGERYEKSLVKS